MRYLSSETDPRFQHIFSRICTNLYQTATVKKISEYKEKTYVIVLTDLSLMQIVLQHQSQIMNVQVTLILQLTLNKMKSFGCLIKDTVHWKSVTYV